MAKFLISGIWKNSENAVTHYAFHTINENIISRADKIPKARAIRLLESNSNSATTSIWNYKQSKWNIGEDIEVVNGSSGKYLRSNPNDKATDNLGHLIDIDWLY